MTRRVWMAYALANSWRGSSLEIDSGPQGIRSLRWRNREFLNAYDPSRQLQCAVTSGEGPQRKRQLETEGLAANRRIQVLRDTLELSASFQTPASPVIYEVPCGSSPPEFSVYLTYDPKRRNLELLSDGPGEGKTPIILSVPDRSLALGVYGGTGAAYARQRHNSRADLQDWNFVQWRCLYRLAKPSQQRFRTHLALGTVAEITGTFDRLYANQPF